jgi:hypothetical protein
MREETIDRIGNNLEKLIQENMHEVQVLEEVPI